MIKQKQKNFFNHCGFLFSNKQQNNKENFWKLTAKVMIFLAIIFIAGFVISVNNLSTNVFVLQELKIKLKNLKAEAENTELKIIALQSYENISQRAKELEMVKVDKIDYVIVGSGEVAKK